MRGPRDLRRRYGSFQRWRRGLVRNSEAGELLELFLVAAIASVLVIRAYLAATGYPQLGGDGLHIAHMLWGGAFMMVALVLLLTFLNRTLQRPAAILAGIGFGTFIDELGKFITSDNDYFFEPTIGIIYIIFILIFLLLRSVRRARSLTPDEALVNALNQMEEAADGVLDPHAKAHTLALLDQCDPSHPLVPHLREFAESVETEPDDTASFYFRLKEWMLGHYGSVVRKKWFGRVFLGLFVAWGIAQVVTLGDLNLDLFGESSEQDSDWVRSAQAASTFVSGVLVLIGVWVWRFSRAGAYRWFMRATLVSIFITQVFIFFDSELAAIYGLVVNVLAYVGLSFMAHLEEDVEEIEAVSPEILAAARATVSPLDRLEH